MTGLLCTTLGLGGCQYILDTPETRSATIIVGEANAGKTIDLPVGEVLEVRLASSDTAIWRTEPLGGESLAPFGRQPEYMPPRTPAGAGISPGQDRFRFQAKKVGAETLRFAYIRPGKREEVLRRLRYRVVVR